MRCRIIPIAAHRPTRLRRTGTIPSTASIFLTQRVRGWGLGGTPPGTRPFNATSPMRFLPGIFSGLRLGAAGAPHCIVNPLVWLPFRVRGHPRKGKGAQRSGPALLAFLMCPATHGSGATQIKFAAEDPR